MDSYGRGRGGGGARGGSRGGGGRGGARTRMLPARTISSRASSFSSQLGGGGITGLSRPGTGLLSGAGLSTPGMDLGSLSSPQFDLGASDLASRIGGGYPPRGGQGRGRGGGPIPPSMRPELPWEQGGGYEEPYPPEEMPPEEAPLDLEQIGEMVAAEFGGLDDIEIARTDLLDLDAFGGSAPILDEYAGRSKTRIELLAENVLFSSDKISGRRMLDEIGSEIRKKGRYTITQPVFKAIRKHYGDSPMPLPPAPRRSPIDLGPRYGADGPSQGQGQWSEHSHAPKSSSTFVDGLKIGAGVTAGIVGVLAIIGVASRAIS